MNTIRDIFAADFRQLLHSRRALVVAIAVIVLSCACAWYSVGTLWNPYQRMENVPLAVVNQDAGAQVAGKSLNVGSLLENALLEDDSHAWDAVDAEEAEAGLASGRYYAQFVIPKEFTQDFVSVLSGGSDGPVVYYGVNQSRNAMGLGVVDEGSAAVSTSVESAFASVLSDVVDDASRKIVTNMNENGGAARSHVQSGLDRASLVIGEISEGLLRASDAINTWRDTVASTRASLESLAASVPGLGQSTAEGQRLLTSARSSAHDLSAAYTGALAQGGTSVVSTVQQVAERVRDVANHMESAQDEVSSAVNTAKDAVARNEQVIASLEGLAKERPELEPQIADLKKKNDELATAVAALESASGNIGSAAGDAAGYADEVAKQVSDTMTDVMSGNSDYDRNVMPALDSSMDALALALGSLDSAMSGLTVQISQAEGLMTQLDAVLTRTQVILDRTVASLGTASYNLLASRYDLAAIAGTGMAQGLASSLAGQQEGVHVMSSPVSLSIQELYPVNSNGALVAPFYLCLAIWLAALMLVAVFRVQPETAEYPRRVARRMYGGRLLLVFALTAIQSVIAAAGCLVMGTGAASIVALLLAGVFTAFAFASITYSMAVSYGRVGRALAVLFLVIQVLVLSGAYPVRLMPEFVQGLVMWLPLSHGMGAMQEAIGGFYGPTYALELAWLLACGAVACACGLLIRPQALGYEDGFEGYGDHYEETGDMLAYDASGEAPEDAPEHRPDNQEKESLHLSESPAGKVLA